MVQQELDYMFTHFTVHKLVWQVLVWDEVLWPNRKYAMVASEGRLIGSYILTQEALGQLRLPWIKVEERGAKFTDIFTCKIFSNQKQFSGKWRSLFQQLSQRPNFMLPSL